MRLGLLRHAKSSWDSAELADHDRPLAPRGRRAAAAVRQFLESERHSFNLVLTSTAARARDTAERVFGGTASEIQELPDLYMASARELLDTAVTQGAAAGSVVLVAHDPGMHSLAARLVRGDSSAAAARIREKFPTCAFAEFELDVDDMGHPAAERAELITFVRPKDLPDAARLRL